MKFLVDAGKAVLRKVTGQTAEADDSVFAQRRKYSRVRTSIPHPEIKCVWPDGGALASLVELSASGLRLEVNHRWAPGTLISLSYSKNAPASEVATVHARVVWCRKVGSIQLTGLAFADNGEALAKSWVRRVLLECGLTPEKSPERRRDQRIQAGVDGELVVKGARYPVPISDLSRGGALVRATLRFSVGDELFLSINRSGSIPGLDLPCKVLEVTPVLNGRQFHIRLRFHTYDETVRRVLTDHLRHLLKKH